MEVHRQQPQLYIKGFRVKFASYCYLWVKYGFVEVRAVSNIFLNIISTASRVLVEAPAQRTYHADPPKETR